MGRCGPVSQCVPKCRGSDSGNSEAHRVHKCCSGVFACTSAFLDCGVLVYAAPREDYTLIGAKGQAQSVKVWHEVLEVWWFDTVPTPVPACAWSRLVSAWSPPGLRLACAWSPPGLCLARVTTTRARYRPLRSRRRVGAVSETAPPYEHPGVTFLTVLIF